MYLCSFVILGMNFAYGDIFRRILSQNFPNSVVRFTKVPNMTYGCCVENIPICIIFWVHLRPTVTSAAAQSTARLIMRSKWHRRISCHSSALSFRRCRIEYCCAPVRKDIGRFVFSFEPNIMIYTRFLMSLLVLIPIVTDDVLKLKTSGM